MSVLTCSSLTGCGSNYPPAPACRAAQPFIEHVSANAGCFISYDDTVVTTRHKTSGKLDLPGGTSASGETAQCTAHRETWEETGMDVEVGPLLYVFSNGFRLYRCASSGEFPYTDAANELPSWVYNEVSAVQLTNPSRTNSADWRFASNRPILIQLLQQSVDQ